MPGRFFPLRQSKRPSGDRSDRIPGAAHCVLLLFQIGALFECGEIDDRQIRALKLDDLPTLQIAHDPCDRFAAGSNALRDFSVFQSEMNLYPAIGHFPLRGPLEEKARKLGAV